MLLTQTWPMHEQVMHSCEPRWASTLEAPAAAASALIVPRFVECEGASAVRFSCTNVRCCDRPACDSPVLKPILVFKLFQWLRYQCQLCKSSAAPAAAPWLIDKSSPLSPEDAMYTGSSRLMSLCSLSVLCGSSECRLSSTVHFTNGPVGRPVARLSYLYVIDTVRLVPCT